MIKSLGALISLFLIGIIFLRLPEQDAGLVSFGNKNNRLGSPASARRLLNILTAVGVIFYFVTAIQLNLVKPY